MQNKMCTCGNVAAFFFFVCLCHVLQLRKDKINWWNFSRSSWPRPHASKQGYHVVDWWSVCVDVQFVFNAMHQGIYLTLAKGFICMAGISWVPFSLSYVWGFSFFSKWAESTLLTLVDHGQSVWLATLVFTSSCSPVWLQCRRSTIR